MLNPRKIREFFIDILQNTQYAIVYKQSFKPITQNIDSIDSHIVQNYQAITKLSNYSQRAIFKIFNHNKNLKSRIYRHEAFLQYSMQTEADKELEKLKNFIEKIFIQYNLKRPQGNANVNSKISEIISFLQPHIRLVGKFQAVKDLQRGLSLLNKNRRNSPIEVKNILLEDGVYGHKTQGCLCDVCKNYSVNVIKKYIKKGIQNNVIFDTKNNSSIDTKKLMEGLCINIERRA